MNDSLRILLAVQEVDHLIAELKSELATLDDGSKIRSAVFLAQSEIEKMKASAHELEKEIRDGEWEMQSINSKIKTLEDKAFSGKITNAKELSAIEADIEALKRTVGKIEDRLIPLYDQLEAKKSEINDLQVKIEAASVKAEKLKQSYESKSKSINEKLSQFEQKRQEFAKRADPQLLRKYEQIRSKLARDAVVPLKEDKCGGCRMSLSSIAISSLKDDSKVHSCDNCGRFLYIEE